MNYKNVSFQQVEKSDWVIGETDDGWGNIFVAKALNDELLALVEQGIRIKALAYGSNFIDEWYRDVDIMIENLKFVKERGEEKNDVQYHIHYNLPEGQAMMLSRKYTNFKITQAAHW